MALIPVALAVVGGISQGNAQDAQAQSQARNMRTNAMYANNAADDALTRGRYDAALQRIRTGQMIGTQRTAMAANGGLVDEGTNAVLQQDTAQLGELDALTIQNNAAREAYGLKVQAMQRTLGQPVMVPPGKVAAITWPGLTSSRRRPRTLLTMWCTWA